MTIDSPEERAIVAAHGGAGVITAGAEFSRCRRYRYKLWRRWREGDDVSFIGLNPSTADETVDDPTIRRCVGFAKKWGFGGLVMLNVYAFRATDPKQLLNVADPVGPENDEFIKSARGLIIAAWGNNCPMPRALEVLDLIPQAVECLGTTKAGQPKHPLYLRADTQPQIFARPNVHGGRE